MGERLRVCRSGKENPGDAGNGVPHRFGVKIVYRYCGDATGGAGRAGFGYAHHRISARFPPGESFRQADHPPAAHVAPLRAGARAAGGQLFRSHRTAAGEGHHQLEKHAPGVCTGNAHQILQRRHHPAGMAAATKDRPAVRRGDPRIGARAHGLEPERFRIHAGHPSAAGHGLFVDVRRPLLAGATFRVCHRAGGEHVCVHARSGAVPQSAVPRRPGTERAHFTGRNPAANVAAAVHQAGAEVRLRPRILRDRIQGIQTHRPHRRGTRLCHGIHRAAGIEDRCGDVNHPRRGQFGAAADFAVRIRSVDRAETGPAAAGLAPHRAGRSATGAAAGWELPQSGRPLSGAGGAQRRAVRLEWALSRTIARPGRYPGDGWRPVLRRLADAAVGRLTEISQRHIPTAAGPQTGSSARTLAYAHRRIRLGSQHPVHSRETRTVARAHRMVFPVSAAGSRRGLLCLSGLWAVPRRACGVPA